MDLNVEKMLTAAINDAQKSIVSPYITTATVTSISGDTIFVRIPGSDNPTPIKASSVAVSVGDIVDLSVSHSDTHITGNRTDKAATSTVASNISKKHAEEVKDFVDAEYVKLDVLEVEKAKIKDLETENIKVNGLLEADKAKIEELKADKADIKDLNVEKARIDELEVKSIKIDTLEADNATIKGTLEANKAVIDNLDTTYATIDFSNIGKAAMEYFYANSGLIKDVVVGNQTITGELIGVTIKGDLIEGNTIKADKLVIKGSDGLFYKLNVDSLGETTASSDPKYQNGLDGSNIIAKSITAEKVSVSDLVAFGATIGGFHISDKSLYSGVKDSINNTIDGVYLGHDGQIYIGGLDDYIRYYKSAEDDKWKLDISADNIRFGTGRKTIEQAVDEKFNNLELGGRNLLRNSNFATSWSPSNTSLSIDNTYQKFGNNSIKMVNDNIDGSSKKYVSISSTTANTLTIGIDEAKGKNLTFSMWVYVENEGDVPGFEFRVVYTKNNTVQWNAVNKNYSYNIPSPSNLSVGWNYLYGVYSIAEDTTRVEASFNINAVAGAQGKVWVSSPKLEFGTKPSDWSLAIEDVEDTVEEASKVATNYMNFDDNGLVVGDMTNNTLGNNVLIDYDSVDIRDGETVLASYGSDIILYNDNSEAFSIKKSSLIAKAMDPSDTSVGYLKTTKTLQIAKGQSFKTQKEKTTINCDCNIDLTVNCPSFIVWHIQWTPQYASNYGQPENLSGIDKNDYIFIQLNGFVTGG